MILTSARFPPKKKETSPSITQKENLSKPENNHIWTFYQNGYRCQTLKSPSEHPMLAFWKEQTALWLSALIRFLDFLRPVAYQ